ncbi:vegetative cell wall protein gp1 [Impatiens glandulifera]|uniref:vegetative cell wall protein gp1 n=1 Tax=Impatiens glandulifera TaxID=253017 RepID=UPI001FB18C5F|nr:vegetative cell wall protein gp1 [Impatiens glandulifera]
MSTESITPNIAGMSKNQLYEIMCQMQALIDQNEPQARQILVQNPGLTKALFQAQIMLGMVRPSQPAPNAQPAASAQQPPQSVVPAQQPNTQATQPEQSHQTVSSLAPPLARKQQHFPSMIPSSSTNVPPALQSPPSLQNHPLQPVQPMGHLSAQTTHIPPLPSIPPHIGSQALPLQPPMPTGPTQLQQPMQTSGFPHMPLQPPLPPQQRPQQPSMPAFSHQHHSQMGLNVGFPHSGAPPQMHHSQPVYHPSIKPSPNMGPSFQQAPLPSQSPYQMGNSHGVGEFSSQLGGGAPINQERGPTAWMPENPMPTLFQGPPPPLGPGSSSQPARPPSSITPEMEKALLQQVMNLTQDQINHLPPEQRNQVLQLQQMLLRQ